MDAAFRGRVAISQGSNGGNATGGTAQIQTYAGGGVGGTINIGSADVHANAAGGTTQFSSGSRGGDGTGGSASITVNHGAINIDGDANVAADGSGGSSEGGIGGNGFGGALAYLDAFDGDINIGGHATLLSSAARFVALWISSLI